MQEFIKKYDLINKFIALFIATVLWSVVVNIKNPIITKSYNDILVEFTSLSLIEDTYDLVIVSTEFPTVDVKLKGSRDDFVQTTVANIIVTADLSHISTPGEYQIDYNVKTPYSDMEVTGKYPEVLTVIFDVMEVKQIPVNVELTGTPASSYSFDEINAVSTITISGPSNELAKVSTAYANVDVSNASETVTGTYDVVLLDEYGEIITSENISQSRKTIDVELPILQTVSVPLAVDLVYGDVVNPKRIEGYDIETPYVAIIGEPEEVSKVRVINIGEIEVDDTQYGKSEFIFALPTLENVSYTSSTPTSVIVSINFTDYTTGTFNVRNFEYDKDLFEDNMLILNDEVEVTISGSNAELQTLEADDFSMEVIVEREIIETQDEDGNDVITYVPLEVGFYNCVAILKIESQYDFDVYEEYTVIIEVLEVE